MNYTEFKEWLMEFLWKSGDTVLLDRLDQLIKMGTSELTRKLDVQERHVAVALPVESQELTLPADYYKMRAINMNSYELRYVPPAELREFRDSAPGVFQPIYSLMGSDVALLVNNYSVSNPGSATVEYLAKLPDFEAEDASWIADSYLDLYTYTCLKHAGPFLREDERVGIWATSAQAIIEEVMTDEAHNRARGTNARVRLPFAASAGRSNRR